MTVAHEASGMSRVAGLVLVGALVVGACTAPSDRGGDEAAGGTSGEDEVETADVASEARAAGTPDAAAEPARAEAVDPAAVVRPGDREVIYTARVGLRVDDVEAVAADAARMVADAGGFLFAQESALEGEPTITVTYRVPPGVFDMVLGGIAALGEVTDQEVASEDVTGQVVDLEARLDAARTSTDRLRELLADSGNVADLLNVERELAMREGEVESLTAQLKAIRARVDLATITVDLTQPEAPVAPTVDDDIPGFLAGLERGWVALLNAGAVALTAIGFALPFLVAVLLAAVAALVLWRRRRPTPATP